MAVNSSGGFLVAIFRRFCNSKFFVGGVDSCKSNPVVPGTTCHVVPAVCLKYLAWVYLPGAYAPTSLFLRITGTRRLPLNDERVVLEEGIL